MKKKLGKTQMRPKSAKTHNDFKQSDLSNKALLNATMKNYYKDYDRIKNMLGLPEQSAQIRAEDYQASVKRVEELVGQWNEATDFNGYGRNCNCTQGIDDNKKRSLLSDKKDIRDDYMERLRKSLKEEEQKEDEEDYEFDNEKDLMNIGEDAQEKDLKEIKESSHSGKSEEEYQYDFNEHSRDRKDKKKKSEDKNEGDEEHYSFNDKENFVKDRDNRHHQDNKEEEEEEYKFDEEIERKGDQMIQITDNRNIFTEEEERKEERDDNQDTYQFPKDNAKAQLTNQLTSSKDQDKSQANEIGEEVDDTTQHKPKQIHKASKDAHKEPHITKNPSPPQKDNSLNQTPYRNSQSSFRQKPNDFFEVTNDKIILDDFEKKVFNKESNILHIDNCTNKSNDLLISNFESIVYSEKEAIAIQRFWKKFRLRRILNEKRLRLALEFDRSKQFVLFIYADRVDAQENIEALFLRIYSIEKMKTSFDWLSVDDLTQLDVMKSENDKLSVTTFKAIKAKLIEKTVGLITAQNIKKKQ